MQWILVLYFAFNSGGYHQGGGGGIALDHIEFHTEEQCKSAGEQILANFNSINGYTSVYNKTNRKYLCIHREDPNKTKRKKWRRNHT